MERRRRAVEGEAAEARRRARRATGDLLHPALSRGEEEAEEEGEEEAEAEEKRGPQQQLHSCTHDWCTNTESATGKRKRYHSARSTVRHEQGLRHHENCCPSSCAACKRWEGRRKGKPAKGANADYLCRHANGCSRRFSQKTGLIDHELREEHGCEEGCERCADASKAKHARDKRRRVDEEIERARRLEMEKVEEVQQLRERVANLPWHTLAQMARTQPPDVSFAAQARALLQTLSPGQSVPEIIARLIRDDPNIMLSLQTRHLILGSPPLQAGAAAKPSSETNMTSSLEPPPLPSSLRWSEWKPE
ncbi:hypothetical protein QOT17_015209 [Balamuthia mandrillaris]